MTENTPQELQSMPQNGFQQMKYFQLGEMRVCAGCHHHIHDNHCLMMDDKVWHDGCLKCRYCHEAPSSSCYFKNGEVFCCKEHYKSMYPLTSCAGCQKSVVNGQRIIRVGNLMYHKDCCQCEKCGREIRPRETCRFDAHSLCCNECSERTFSYEELDDIIPHMYQQCEFGDRKLTKRQRKTSLPIDPKAPTRYGFDYGGDPNPGYQHQKAKRIRTSFSPGQLERMKEHFKNNQNPDANALQRLADETNLTKRTLQIWFQNTRAKHRRAEKSDSSGKKTKNGSLSEKIEKRDYADDEVERLANESVNSVDSKQESDKGDGQSFSGSVLEFDSRSPGLESFSGDSRSDTAESSSTSTVPWTFDGLYQPDYQNLQAASYARNADGIYHCAAEFEEHMRREMYKTENGEATNFNNFNEYIPSSKQTFTGMYNSLAR